jgi:hypothetical protein
MTTNSKQPSRTILDALLDDQLDVLEGLKSRSQTPQTFAIRTSGITSARKIVKLREDLEK